MRKKNETKYIQSKEYQTHKYKHTPKTIRGKRKETKKKKKKSVPLLRLRCSFFLSESHSGSDFPDDKWYTFTPPMLSPFIQQLNWVWNLNV